MKNELSLEIKKDIKVDELCASTFICGANKSGKSTLAMHIAANLLRNDVVLFIIDPTRHWLNQFKLIKNTLTILSENQELSSIDWNTSYIIDIARLNMAEMPKFVDNFCNALMEKATEDPSKSRMVILEEAQLLPSPIKEKLPRVMGLISMGRHYGAHYMAITQFPTMVDKCLPTYAVNRFYLKMTTREQIGCLKKFIGERANALAKKPVGQCLYEHNGDFTEFEFPPFGGDKPKPFAIPVKRTDFPLIEKAIRSAPMKELTNQMKDSKHYGENYIFVAYPFGEAASKVYPELIEEIGEGIYRKIKELNVDFDYIVCIGFNDKWAAKVSEMANKPFLRLCERELEIPSEEKLEIDTILYGKKTLYLRDFKKGDKVIFIDDVISSGITSEKIIRFLRRCGLEVVGAFYIIAKGEGYKKIEKLGIPVRFLKRQNLPKAIY